MAKELPYFRFTVSEWLNDDISLEDYRLQGVFISVCAFYWFQDCSITKAKLKKRFSDAQEEVEELLKLGILKNGERDLLQIKFLDEQYDLLSEKRQNRVKAGRKGGLKRASNAKAKVKQSLSYKDKDKDNNKDKDKEENVDTPVDQLSDTEVQAKEVAEYLLGSIIHYDPSHRYASNTPSINSWIKDIDRAIRLDGRTVEQLKFIIEYIYRANKKHSDFWAGNIESGKKLRKHFDKIKTQIQSERKNGRATKSEIDRNAELLGNTANSG